MPSKTNEEPAAPQAEPNARLATSAENRSKAQRWFERARELGDKRQYDHAIQYYVEGLEYWPDAVEEGCKPLHGCAVARKHNGGAKPGLKDQMKHPVKHKDARRAFLNALWLFGHDPDNVGYIEAAVRNAAKLRADDAAMWAAGVLYKALEGNPKTSPKHFQALVEHAEQLGDRAAARNEAAPGETAYQLGINAVHVMRRRFPKSRDVDLALRNLSTKLTIHKGKYQDGESFRESIADADEQMELHDLDRGVQNQDRVVELAAHAEQEYLENPDAPGAFQKLIDLLRRQETDEAENRAIGLLVQEYKKTGDFRWKMLAQDVRIKQLNRLGRKLHEEGDAEAIRKHTIDQLKFELSSYKERVEQYPTDNRLKYEYGARLFRAGRFDDAIPLFQAARVDPKNRGACALHLGRCFYRKGFLPEAMASLSEGLKEHEFDDDDLAKSMLYWLGRAQEDAHDADGARKTYGRLLQVDYNYKDVRARMEGLPAG
jgi:tetratricopeptide (TPR) repeat protein